MPINNSFLSVAFCLLFFTILCYIFGSFIDCGTNFIKLKKYRLRAIFMFSPIYLFFFFLLKDIHILLTCLSLLVENIGKYLGHDAKKHLASCAGVTVDEHRNQRATLGELYYYYYCSPQWALEALALGQQLGTVLDSCALSFFPITF